MKFQIVKPTENFTFRLQADSVELGLFNVLFGTRIRAGYVGQPCCELDWCGGAESNHISYLFHLALNILELREPENAFKDLPGSSRIKPAVLDQEFLQSLERFPKGDTVIRNIGFETQTSRR